MRTLPSKPRSILRPARCAAGALAVGLVIGAPIAALRSSGAPADAPRHHPTVGATGESSDAVDVAARQKGVPTKAAKAVACNKACQLALTDSDADGYSDAYEIVAYTDPLNAQQRPGDKLNQVLTTKQVVRPVAAKPGGRAVYTTPNLLPHEVDLTQKPDGSAELKNDLVDLDGKALKKNNHGVDITGSHIDVVGLAQAFKTDPSLQPESSMAPPKEKPELHRRNDPSLYSDDEGDEGPEEDPADDPGDGGDEGDIGADEKKPDPADKFKPEPKKELQPYDKEEPSLLDQLKDTVKKLGEAVDSAKCGTHYVDCQKYSDPDATNTPMNAPGERMKDQIAPKDPVRDSEPLDPHAVPHDQTQNGDPSVIHTDPDAVQTPTVNPGSSPSVAPIDNGDPSDPRPAPYDRRR